MSFYVTLPSDSSMHFFPENKISHFKTQLPSPVCLNGEWEVGLSEIIYPHSWLNVNETNNYFLYKVGDGNISSIVKRTIDVGCYETMLDIISAAQLALPKNPNRFTIIYNKATKRVKINAVQGSSLHLENLGELLGFKRNAIIIGENNSTRPLNSKIKANAGEKQLNRRKQLNSSVGMKQLNSAPPSTACTAFTAESAFSTY
ncbi:uncharacterized protein TNCV_1781981 [Trichonephila clavipes]|nr:uncharacterized protein TNCV_1781981 [Trichonephila clavipes]